MMAGHHDPGLVVLSVLIAIFASYTALDLATTVPTEGVRRRVSWIALGSLAMGVGIWSMHFTGMLAFHLPGYEIAYERRLLLASVLVAIFVAFLALTAISRQRLTVSAFVIAGLLMGAAISGMHYTGMAALRTAATIQWNYTLVAASIVIAVTASLAALTIALRVRRAAPTVVQYLKVGGGVVMGFAIAGMHYTGMAAAKFEPLGAGQWIGQRDVLATGTLAFVVISSSIVILAIATGGSIVTREMTRRSELMLRISESEEYFRALIENASDLISVLAPDGTTKFVSPSYERVLGYAPAELVGQNAFAYIHPEDVPLAHNALERLVRTPGGIERIELRARHRDGSWRTLRVAAQNLLDFSAVRGLVVTAQDETERHRLEAQFQQSQKMEAVGKLAGGIAHDFNNLLTVIIGNVQWLLDDPATSEETKAGLTEVAFAADRAAGLTRQLLAFSRRQILQPRVVDLNEIVTGMQTMLDRLLGEDIRIEADLEPAVWRVQADPGQVEQAIMNLAVNARDAMPKGGILRLCTSNVRDPAEAEPEDGAVPPGDYVCVSVADTGAGIDAATMKRMFEPFFTTKEVGKGTGLGLSTVYGIMKQTGGFVTARSEVGQGSDFKLFFQRSLEPADREPSAVAAPASSARPNETILLVDSDSAMRKLAARVLGEQGYNVIATERTEEALRFAHDHAGPIHLLISEITLSGRSGPQNAESISALRPGMRILFVSQRDESDARRQGDCGDDADFLQKPFTPSSLLDAVESALT